MTIADAMGNEAMLTVLRHISHLPAGKSPEVFGYIHTKDGLRLSTASKRAPTIHMALQYLIRNYFRINNVITIRLGKSVHKVPKCDQANGSTLIHYTNDTYPHFHYYETTDTALNIPQITT